MSYLEDMIARAKGGKDLFDSPVAPLARTEKNSVQPDSYDRMTWEWITDAIPALRKQVDDLGSDFETSPWAYEDLFYLMYKTVPQATPEELLIEKFKPQALMMNMIGASDELRHLRHETRLDDYNTAFAMLTMRDRMRKAFEDLQEAINASDAADQALADALAAAQAAQASGEGQDEAAQALAEALAARGQALADAEEGAAEAASSIQGAADMAAKSIENERSMMSAWGYGPGKLQRMSFEERRALSERLSKSRMAQFMKMIGAQRLSADADVRRSMKRSPTRTADTELGRDLNRLTSGELARLAIPELAEDFELRFVRRRLQLKKFNAPPHLDRGPAVFVCDESYSMTEALDSDGNTREMWSKAVALAAADTCRRQKRDFIYIGFASRGEQWSTSFPGGNMSLEDVTTFTEHFFGGGTHYETPLQQAMEVCLDYIGKRKPRPDIIFVTDDECRVNPEFVEVWHKARIDNDIRCYGVQVGGSGQYQTMQSLTDRQLSITSLNAGPDGMAEIFRSL